MGIRGISIGSILLVLVIVIVIFGTKRLRHIGEDMGSALKSFRKGLSDDDSQQDSKD